MNKSNSTKASAPQRSGVERKRKLGKGLGALLGESKREEPLVRGGASVGVADQGDENAASDTLLKTLSVAKIDPLPGNPRKHFDEAALVELAASIASRTRNIAVSKCCADCMPLSSALLALPTAGVSVSTGRRYHRSRTNS